MSGGIGEDRTAPALWRQADGARADVGIVAVTALGADVAHDDRLARAVEVAELLDGDLFGHRLDRRLSRCRPLPRRHREEGRGVRQLRTGRLGRRRDAGRGATVPPEIERDAAAVHHHREQHDQRGDLEQPFRPGDPGPGLARAVFLGKYQGFGAGLQARLAAVFGPLLGFRFGELKRTIAGQKIDGTQ